MKKVLIALDYNPSAQKIAETGYGLAKAMNARTVLLHVISDPTYYSSLNYSPIMGFDSFNSVDTIQSDTAEKLKKAAQNFLDKSKEYLGDERIETVVSKGDFGDTILETATKLNADLIVMGTHSRRGLEKILVGSVAENVLHHSLIPLFIIPTKTLKGNQ
ncbi:universal stress protein [Chitinophagaceae bacterium LB-8]|uniref:Universal stress protein n=1 Tax=Paraflavisolibacter caeni TaxID=2982496 RepID=A0A9X2XNV5_9BACT|nr:universal stress protein [Paraflavisolibacter caeni]MCU7549209.1 universal stress protein [Paraflavisolibacter caeni]